MRKSDAEEGKSVCFAKVWTCAAPFSTRLKHQGRVGSAQAIGRFRGVTLYTNGVARATPSKKSATPSLRLPPHHLAPYTVRPRVMKAPARAKEHTHGQKVPEVARNGHKTGRVKQQA